jgi:hypothetical protein
MDGASLFLSFVPSIFLFFSVAAVALWLIIFTIQVSSISHRRSASL